MPADAEFWSPAARLGDALPTETAESSQKPTEEMPLPSLIKRFSSAERSNSVECSNGTASATEGSPVPAGSSSPTRHRLSQRHSHGSFGSSSSFGSAGRHSPDALSLSTSRPGSPTRIRRSVDLARRISRGRSMQGEMQENNPATRHEEDSVVNGHTIQSFQPSSPLKSPVSRDRQPTVSRQPTPVIMGDRLTSALPLPMSPIGSSASSSTVDHAAVRLTAGGRRIGGREDEIEDEIMGARADSFISRGAPPPTPRAEREAVNAHTIRRPSGQFDPNHFEALNDSQTNLPRLPAPAPAAAPVGAPVGAPVSAPASAPAAAPVVAPAAAPAAAALLQGVARVVSREGVARVVSRERERRPSIASINSSVESSVWNSSYQEEQQAVVVRKMHEVAQGEVSFLGKLGRVRRGEAFRWRNPKHQENVLDTFGRGALGRGILKATIPARPSDGGGEADSAPKRHEPDPHTEFLRAAAPAEGSHEEAADRYESYQFDEPESKLHFEERVDNSGKTVKTLQLLVSTTVIILAIGACIGLTSAFIAIVEGHIFSLRFSLVMSRLWPCCHPIAEHADDIYWLHGSASMDCSECLATHAANASSTTGDVAVAAVAFVGFSAALMLLAALLCVWAPRAALSGLPQVKACRAAWSKRPSLVAAHTATYRSSSPPACSGLPLGPRGAAPRHLDAEEGLRRCSSACPESSTPLLLPHPDLNGTRVPHLLRASTLVAKAVGVTLV